MQKLIFLFILLGGLILPQLGYAQTEMFRTSLPYSTGEKAATIVVAGESDGMAEGYNLMFTVVSTKVDTLTIYQYLTWYSMGGYFKHKIYAPYLQENPLTEIVVDNILYDEAGDTLSGYYGVKFLAHTPFASGTWKIMKNDTIGFTSTDTLFIRAQRHLPN